MNLLLCFVMFIDATGFFIVPQTCRGSTTSPNEDNPSSRSNDSAENDTTLNFSNKNDNGDELMNNPTFSLELLAVVVSLFFVATVALVGGDKLFVTAPPGSPLTERVVIDADALLSEEFDRVSSSVKF